ncbi:STAS domain-containing protein [Streptomyces sp. NPDC101733]|uniref:STAS domain-containing protein n=1 Tax=unclassified Streptomyces TaxID=2593676 RepID=UPI0037FF3787
MPRGSPARLFRIAGELDVAAVPVIRDAVRTWLGNRSVLLRSDLGGVSFSDCSGLCALWWASR